LLSFGVFCRRLPSFVVFCRLLPSFVVFSLLNKRRQKTAKDAKRQQILLTFGVFCRLLPSFVVFCHLLSSFHCWTKDGKRHQKTAKYDTAAGYVQFFEQIKMDGWMENSAQVSEPRNQRRPIGLLYKRRQKTVCKCLHFTNGQRKL